VVLVLSSMASTGQGGGMMSGVTSSMGHGVRVTFCRSKMFALQGNQLAGFELGIDRDNSLHRGSFSVVAIGLEAICSCCASHWEG